MTLPDGTLHPTERQLLDELGSLDPVEVQTDNADHWVTALRQLQDPTAYATYSNRARQHALRFAAGPTVAQFLHAVRGAMGIDL